MNQILSEVEREKRAREVYKSAYWSAFFVGFVIFFALEIAVVLVQSWLKIAPSNASWLNGLVVVSIVVGPRLWAFKSLRRSGLLHEEHEVLVRTGDVDAGETIEFCYPKSVWGKLALLAAFAMIGVGSWWMWQYENEKFIGALGMLMGFGLFVLSARSFNLPNFRLDDQGIFGYVYGSGLWPRLVRWDEIGSVHIERIAGLPAPWFKKDAVVETVTLKTQTGKMLMRLNANTFVGASPTWKQHFIAELKRRLADDEIDEEKAPVSY